MFRKLGANVFVFVANSNTLKALEDSSIPRVSQSQFVSVTKREQLFTIYDICCWISITKSELAIIIQFLYKMVLTSIALVYIQR